MESKSPLYDQDFYAWANQQAALLRAGTLAGADLERIAEEIESMGRTERRELTSRLRVLALHLLKWRFQPSQRGASREASIRIQRRDIARHLRDNPSLKGLAAAMLAESYEDAILEAVAETGLPISTFPAACPWPFEQAMDESFWPE